ncbi:MAG: methylglyoxal synthase [Scytonema hyalinum WJT4-NPBG1]|jgi:methylglyoxal synthase|nr:methylglyoxal synthase [Scytonema hyalinum WJT4-NPBG1]
MKVKVSHSPTLSEFPELDLSLANKKGREWTVGRSPDADLVLDSPDVSRLHGKFFFQGGNYYFCDFGSRNGSILNGKLAVTNQPYILRDGDIIRIGDFTLMMEEIISLPQQAETVVRIINPSLFSPRRSTENADNASVDNQTPEVVSLPEKVSNESGDLKTPVAEQFFQTTGEVENPEIVNASADLKTPVAEQSFQTTGEVENPEIVNASADLKTPVAEQSFQTTGEVENPEIVNASADLKTPVAEQSFQTTGEVENPEIVNASADLKTPVAEQSFQTTGEVEIPEIANAASVKVEEVSSKVTVIQSEDTANQVEEISRLESTIQPSPAASQAPSVLSNEATDIANQADEEVRADVGSQAAEIITPPIPEIGEHSDFTYVQPRNIIDQFPDEITIPQSTSKPAEAVSISEAASDENVDIATQLTEDKASQPVNAVTPEVEELLNYTIVQRRDITGLSEEKTTTKSTSDSVDAVSEAPEVVSSVAAPESKTEAPEVVSSVTTPESETEAPEVVSSITTPESKTEAPEVVSSITTPESKTEAPEVVSSVAAPESQDVALNKVELETINVSTQSEELEEDETASEVTTISESQSVSETPELSSQTIEEVSETESQQLDEISETSVSEYPDLSQKRIVLIAHESKKSELADFVAEHQKFFSLCHTITWSSVSELLHQEVGITISEQISAGTSGGYQTIASLVNSGDISAVIFLKDFLQPQPGQANEDAMLRLCNINQVVVATNVATAEAIVHYIKHTSGSSKK